MSFDRHGNRIWREPAALLESEHARYAVGEVAVPYGTCTEPSNVAAGGGACPVRFRCAGCDHFRTDVSYLPDLTAYLDDLLRAREHLAAAVDGVDDWARAAATPTHEEITRIRRLITRIKGDVTGVTAAERAAVDEAVTVVRRHRAVPLGMPAVRAAANSRRRGGHRMSANDRAAEPATGRTEAMRKGRQADSARRRQRVLTALDRTTADGAEVIVSGIARAAGVDRAFLYRAPRPARQDSRSGGHPARRRHRGRAGRHLRLPASRPAPAGERAVRLNTRVRQLEQRLSDALGERTWRESGLGVPADLDALNQKVGHLEQQVVDLRLQLEERDQDLTGARAANRELMARLNLATRR